MRKLDAAVRGWKRSRYSHRNNRRQPEEGPVAGARSWKIGLSCVVLLLAPFFVAACGSKGIPANVKKFAAVINVSPGVAALRVVGEICANIDCVELLKVAFGSDKSTKGMPTSDNAVFTIIDKSRNSSMHWELTDDVDTIEVEQRSSNNTAIVLKIINEDPLKIELWTLNSDEFTVNVVFK